MIDKQVLLLLGFAESDTKMASVRWRRFKRHLHKEGMAIEWVPVRLPFCKDSSSAASKALCEFKVLHHARRLAKQLTQNLDSGRRTIVLASIPTLDPLYVGAMLKRICGDAIELILEVRDVYARPELFEYGALRRRLEILKEALLIRHVDRLIYLTDEIRRRYCAYYPRFRSIRQGAVITNGYDPGEYGPRPQPQPRGPLDIGYFGSFYASRNPELLLQALGQLKSSDPQGASMTRIHVWGEMGQYPLDAKIRQYALEDIVIYHGVSPHEDVIRECSGTAVNLIITHTMGSSYALPGKLFEYAGARRPIWAVTDDQILRDFMTRHKLGYLSSHDARSIEETLRVILRDHVGAGRLPNIDPPKDFEIGSLTQKLKAFLVESAGSQRCLA
jgi:glycosyltransferase involved in cell wall biosynthesis